MTYKINGEFEELNRASDLSQKTCRFTDFCFEKIKEGVFPPTQGDRAKYYSWAQVIMRELAMLTQEEREYLILSPCKIRTYELGETEKDCGDWMRHDVGFCKEQKPKRGGVY